MAWQLSTRSVRRCHRLVIRCTPLCAKEGARAPRRQFFRAKSRKAVMPSITNSCVLVESEPHPSLVNPLNVRLPGSVPVDEQLDWENDPMLTEASGIKRIQLP